MGGLSGRRPRLRNGASSLEAAESRFDLGLAGEFTTLGLGEAVEDGVEMRGVDVLGLAVIVAQAQHRTGDLVLAFRGNCRTASSAFSRSFVMFVR